MITLTESVQINNDQTVKTEAGEFMICQRNEGYAVNDGKWVVAHLPELYWSKSGSLRQRRGENFLGVFLTPVDVVEAIEAATLQPVNDRMIR